MSWIDVDQNTPDWEQLRVGRVTASSFGVIMAKYDKGIWGESAKKLAKLKAKERLTGVKAQTFIKNKYFDRGHENEPLAVKEYEFYTGNIVTNGGFWEGGDIGGSPDGLVGSKGMIEIKTRIEKHQLPRLKNQNIDPSNKWQIQGNLWLFDRYWCDYISFCPEFKDSRRLFVRRVSRIDDYQHLSFRLYQFEKLINEEIKLLV